MGDRGDWQRAKRVANRSEMGAFRCAVGSFRFLGTGRQCPNMNCAIMPCGSDPLLVRRGPVHSNVVAVDGISKRNQW